MASFRGLVNFISDIRKCQSKEDERDRVYKEMANIRQKFTQATSGKKLSSYDNKKYVTLRSTRTMMKRSHEQTHTNDE